jgi:hypothetical protein
VTHVAASAAASGGAECTHDGGARITAEPCDSPNRLVHVGVLRSSASPCSDDSACACAVDSKRFSVWEGAFLLLTGEALFQLRWYRVRHFVGEFLFASVCVGVRLCASVCSFSGGRYWSGTVQLFGATFF